MENENRTERLCGSVDRVVYQNEENGYAICSFGTDEGDLITIVGTIPYVAEGERLSVIGTWVHNAKYGRQFKVNSYEKELPADQVDRAINKILKDLKFKLGVEMR